MAYHNDLRLHSAIGCVAPKDRLEGSTEAIMADRGRKLSAVRDARKARPWKRKLTERKKEEKLAVVGETDASSAEAQLARGIADRVATNIAQGEPSVPPPALRMRADRCSGELSWRGSGR